MSMTDNIKKKKTMIRRFLQIRSSYLASILYEKKKTSFMYSVFILGSVRKVLGTKNILFF